MLVMSLTHNAVSFLLWVFNTLPPLFSVGNTNGLWRPRVYSHTVLSLILWYLALYIELYLTKADIHKSQLILILQTQVKEKHS